MSKLRTSLMAGIAMLAGSSAYAQSNDNTAQDAQVPDAEIIVTAQKRSESVQDVPISVTVISGDQLARRGVTQVQDLSQASASLEFTAPSASPGGGGFVRGIGTQSLGAATAAPSVSVVLDGVVLGATTLSDIFDTERVEVLKGPQGTLFGSSVSAGVVSITTKRPQIGETSVDLSAEYAIKALGSEYGRHVLRTAVNLPISERTALRVAAYGYGNDGYSRDTATGRDSNFNSYGVRVRLLSELTDALTFNLIADYGRSRDADGPGLIYRFAPPGSPLAQALTACGITASANNVDNCSNLPKEDVSQVGGVSGQFDLDLGGSTLTSITSWRRTRQDARTDVINISTDATRAILGSQCFFANCIPIVSLTTGNPNQTQAAQRGLVAQELRLTSDAGGRFEWVAGAFYQRATYDLVQPTKIVIHPTLALGIDADVTFVDSITTIDAKTEDFAAFGNVTYNLSSATRLFAGLRYTHSEVSEFRSVQTVGGLAAPVGIVSGSAAVSDDAATWRLGIQHDLDSQTMAYLTASTGYKAPQINDSDFPLNAIKSERPTSFELGIKTSVLNNRLYFNADIYYTRVKNFQSQSCVPGGSGVICSNVNVPNVNSKGVELELFGRPFDGTTINATASYNDAKYPEGFLGADGSALVGNQLNYAPKYKVTVSGQQEIPINEKFAFVLGGDATFRGKQSMYLSSDPVYVVPAQALFNARIGVQSADNWSLYLFGRNLGNEVYPVQLFPTQAFHPGGLWHVLDGNSRRVVGLQLQASF